MRIALIGYGKMGKTIEKIALDRGHDITLKIDSSNKSEFTTDALKNTNTDVAIEFTHPDAGYDNITKLISSGVKVISGTTGWLDRYDEVVNHIKKHNGSMIYASNFSVGVNLFFEINRKLAQLMNSHTAYDVSIEEIHHITKKDAPSGTAITIAEDIIDHYDHKAIWKSTQVIESMPPSSQGELMISSLREEDVPGTHTITYSSEIDEINLQHIAKSRKGFALGAVLAAEYLQDKDGIYSMKDVLGI